MMKRILLIAAFATANTFCAALFAAQCCTTTVTSAPVEYRVEKPIVHTAYKKVVEMEEVEETVTTYETVWETQQRERRYTVARTVPETTTYQRKVTVQRPVEETVMRDDSYNKTVLVPETTEREERYLVPKTVCETVDREIVETRRVPVEETVMQERRYTVSKPITTFATQTVDRGGFIDTQTITPGRTYNRLAWQSGGTYVNPDTGQSIWRIPGLYWTPMTGAPQVQTQKVYQANYVQETVPVTRVVREQVAEQIPVVQTSYRDEQIRRVEPVQVERTVNEEVVRRVPVTTYRQEVRRVEQLTPVKVQRMVTEERFEDVPVTTTRTIYEERVVPYEVKVQKVVPVTRIVRKPVTREKWVPIESERVVGVTDREVPPKVIETDGSVLPLPSADPADDVPTLATEK